MGEKWNGPDQILLTTFTAIKIKEQPARIHYSQGKAAPEKQWTSEPWDPQSEDYRDINTRVHFTIMGNQNDWTLCICILGLAVVAWEGNAHYQAIKTTVNATRAKDCWVCTALPKGNTRPPLRGVMSTDLSSISKATGINMWKTNSDQSQIQRKEMGQQGADWQIGLSFDPQILKGGIVLHGYVNESLRRDAPHFKIFNLNGTNCTIVNLQNEMAIIKAFSRDTQTPLRAISLNKTVQSRSSKTSRVPVCPTPPGIWWLCGDGIAKKTLPPRWKGTCTLGYLASQHRI